VLNHYNGVIEITPTKKIGRKEIIQPPLKEDNWIIRDTMSLLQVFSANLRRYRHELGLSQEEFADLAGLHRTYISALECGKRSIAIDNVEKIASALSVDAYLLFIDTSIKSSK
jgi:DNA-binding XRE family transcriptional regulator